MQVHEYEKAVLSVILRNPTGKDSIPQRICFELDADKFNPKGVHGTIYRAIKKLVWDKQVPNVPNIARALGNELEDVGGEEYLQSLLGYLSIMGVHGSEGFDTWVRVVDNAGRLRQLGLIIEKYNGMYDDFEKLVTSVMDVDEFSSNFLTEINKGIGSVKSGYVHISEVVEEEKRRLAEERQGKIVDLIPTGWPSLESFFIPRPGTYGVISGLSSMGKTQFALQVMLGTVLYLYNNGLPGCVGINELEMLRWRLLRRLACCMVGINSDELSTGAVKEDMLKKYYEQLEFMAVLPIYLDDNPNLSSTKLVWSAAAMHLAHGPRILGIADYVELFTDDNDSEERRVANVVRNHRKVCWELQSCEIAISQLNNSVMQVASKIGGKERSRYSGAVAHNADWYIEIYNPPQMRLCGIDYVLPDGLNGLYSYGLVEKNKDHRVGKIPFEWTPEITRFRDMALPMNQVYRPAKELKEDF